MPADVPDTTPGVSDRAELHMVRAVNTGIINVRRLLFLLYRSLNDFNTIALFSCARVRSQTTAAEGLARGKQANSICGSLEDGLHSTGTPDLK